MKGLILLDQLLAQEIQLLLQGLLLGRGPPAGEGGEGNRLLHMMLPDIVPAPEAGRRKDGRRAVCQQASENPLRLG